MSDDRHHLNSSPPLPPEFEGLHRRLSEVGEAWRAGLPATERLEQYFQTLVKEEPMARLDAQRSGHDRSSSGRRISRMRGNASMFPGRIKTVTAAVALAAVVTLFAALFYSFAGHSSSPTTTTTTVPNPTTANTTLPSPTATTTMPPSPTATTTAGAVKVVQRSAQSDQVPVGNSGTVTATCEPGEQLLSGGYYVYAFESAANVVASYPSSPDAWTVTDDNTRGPSYVVITAYANCLQAPYSVGVRMVSSDSQSAGDTLANCPSGAVVTGGGFQGGIASSMPTSNGWKSAFLGAGKAFALCATARLRGAPDASATFTTQSVYGPPQGGNAHCKAGQIVTGGGYSFAQGETSIAVDTLAPDGASWGIGAAGGSTPVSVVVWATCVVAP